MLCDVTTPRGRVPAPHFAMCNAVRKPAEWPFACSHPDNPTKTREHRTVHHSTRAVKSGCARRWRCAALAVKCRRSRVADCRPGAPGCASATVEGGKGREKGRTVVVVVVVQTEEARMCQSRCAPITQRIVDARHLGRQIHGSLHIVVQARGAAVVLVLAKAEKPASLKGWQHLGVNLWWRESGKSSTVSESARESASQHRPARRSGQRFSIALVYHQAEQAP